MTNPDSTDSKRHLRQTLRSRPAQVSDLAAASARIRDALLGWLAQRPEIRNLAIFAALPGEPNLLPLLDARPDLLWHLPRVEGPLLHFHPIPAASLLVPGVLGILEPPAHLPETPAHRIDLFLCPGLAFDRSGGRLGRGAGYYDRLLATAPAALLCGVTFSADLLDSVPMEPHDARMHFLVTEEGITPVT